MNHIGVELGGKEVKEKEKKKMGHPHLRQLWPRRAADIIM